MKKAKKAGVRNFCDRFKNLIKRNKEQILITMGMLIASGFVAAMVEEGAFGNDFYMNPYRILAVSVAIFVVLFSIVFKEFIWKKIHVYFFMLSMLLGITFICSVPVISISWDEQLHYSKTVHMSYGANGTLREADYLINSQYPQLAYEDVFKKVQREDWNRVVNDADKSDQVYDFGEPIVISCVAYIPAAMMHFLTRLFGVDFTTRYILGKMTNLLCYSLIMAGAIKQLKSRGKMIVAIVGLLPTIVLMASSYGYDWWVISLIILGFALFLGELQEKGRVSTKRMWLSIGIMTLGMCAKAVYFPLMLPLMLLGKEKYEDSKKARRIVVLGMCLLVASFIIPLIVNSVSGVAGGGGDIRGGADVNAGGQVAFILSNFGTYLKILIGYLVEYLNPDSAVQYTTMMSYRGRGDYFTICLLLMGVISFVDNTDKPIFRGKEKLASIGGYVGVLGAIILVVTALYVSFTAVGADTVEGCQPRYIIPTLFPFLYLAGEYDMKISDDVKAKILRWSMNAMALIFLLATYKVYIIKY